MTKPINITGDATGGQLDARTLTTAILFDAYAGYQLVDSNNPYRLRFSIPVGNIDIIRRVRLSFSMLPAVFVAQAGTIAAGNTGAGTNHNHSENYNSSAASANHNHDWAVTQGGDVGIGTTGKQINDGGGGGVGILPAAPAGTFITNQNGAAHVHAVTGTSSGEASHTHSIAGGAITLSPATALGNTGQATGAHIYLAGPGVTPPGPEVFPRAGQTPPPYAGTDIDDLDFTHYFPKGGVYEFQISSTAIGGIIAQVQVLGTLTAA